MLLSIPPDAQASDIEIVCVFKNIARWWRTAFIYYDESGTDIIVSIVQVCGATAPHPPYVAKLFYFYYNARLFARCFFFLLYFIVKKIKYIFKWFATRVLAIAIATRVEMMTDI